MSLELRIVPEALAKIMHWVRLADKNEVSGFGKVIFGDGLPLVTEVCIVEQINSPGSTEMKSHALSKAMYETKDTPGSLQFWWHSHGHGSTFFSATDLQTIQELGSNGWLLASVFNIHGQVQTSFYSQSPFPFYVDNLALVPELLPLSEADRAAMDQDYRAKVRLSLPRRMRRWNRWERRHKKALEADLSHSGHGGLEVENDDIYGPWISDLRDDSERWNDVDAEKAGEARFHADS